MAPTDRYERAKIPNRYAALSDVPAIDFGRGQANKASLNNARAGVKGDTFAKPGQKLAHIEADHNSAFGGFLGGTPAMKIAYDGTANNLKDSIDATMKQKGLKKKDFHPVMKLSSQQAQKANFNGQDLGDYVVEGALPTKMNKAKLRNTTFSKAAGAPEMAGADATGLAWNDVNADFLKARGANMTSQKMAGRVTARFAQAQNVTYSGQMFHAITDANFNGSTHTNTDMTYREGAYSSFIGAKGSADATFSKMAGADASHSAIQMDLANAETPGMKIGHAPLMIERNNVKAAALSDDNPATFRPALMVRQKRPMDLAA